MANFFPFKRCKQRNSFSIFQFIDYYFWYTSFCILPSLSSYKPNDFLRTRQKVTNLTTTATTYRASWQSLWRSPRTSRPRSPSSRRRPGPRASRPSRERRSTGQTGQAFFAASKGEARPGNEDIILLFNKMQWSVRVTNKSTNAHGRLQNSFLGRVNYILDWSNYILDLAKEYSTLFIPNF